MHKWVEKGLGGLWRFFQACLIAALVPGVPVVIGRLAWIHRVPDYQWILYALVALAFSIFVLNQLLTLKNKVKGGLSKSSAKEIEKKILEWLYIPGRTIEKMPPENGVLFNISVKDNLERHVHISMTSDAPKTIHAVGRVKIVPLRPLDEKEWARLAGKISLEMARLGIEYIFDGDPNKLEFIRLMDPIVIDDSLGSFLLRQRIMFVIRAIILVAATTTQYFADEETRPMAGAIPAPESPRLAT